MCIRFATALLFAIGLASCKIDRVEKQIPMKWQLDFKSKSIGEIVIALGAPSELSSTKQFQNWIEPNEQGFKMLKLICPDRCASSEMPKEIWFSVYKKGTTSAIHEVQLNK
jgi:hypothetical protein